MKMGQEHGRLDQSGTRPTETIYLIVAMCVLSGALSGYNLGVISGAILFIVDDFQLSAALKEVVISGSLLGAMIGAVAGGTVADRIGRKRSVAWGALIGIAATLVAALSPVYAILVAGRIGVGFSFGMLACVTPLFISEISPSALRGRLGALFSVALVIGLLTAYVADFSLRSVDHGWRWMFGLAIVPAALLFFAVRILPESPRWLLARGRVEMAHDCLCRLHGSTNADNEMKRIQAGLTSSSGGWSDLANPVFKMALIAGIGLAVIRHGTGVAISTFCAPELFQLAGFNSRTVELLGTAGVGAVYLIMTLVAVWLVDRSGRRPLMLWGLSGMVVALIVLWAVFQLPDSTGLQGWIVVAALTVFVSAFAIGPGAVVFLLISELYPLRIRAVGMGIAGIALWGAALLSALTFPILLDLTGKSGPFLIYGVLAVMAWFFVYHVIPETKGRSLEEIEAGWQRS